MSNKSSERVGSPYKSNIALNNNKKS